MIERTKNAIVDAFNELITNHDFDKLTVTDIAKKAGVSKATFYRYFKDKYDVMNYNYMRLLDYYAAPERCHNYEELYYNLFFAARESWQYLRNAFNSTGANCFSYYIYQYSYEIAEQITKSNRDGQGFSSSERLQFDVFCKGISYMYENWIFGGYDISAEDAAKALYAMMPETLKYYWWK